MENATKCRNTLGITVAALAGQKKLHGTNYAADEKNRYRLRKSSISARVGMASTAPSLPT